MLTGGRMLGRLRAIPSLALILLLMGACTVAFAPILVRISELPPVATAFYRLALAAPVLLIVLAWQPRQQQPGSVTGLMWIAVAGLAFAGDLGFWHLSIVYTSVANATLFANFAPVVVTAVAWLWLGERVRPLFLVALALALSGAILLIQSSRLLSPTHVVGDIYGLITALFYAAYLIAIKLARAHYGTWSVMAGSTLIGALALLPFAWVMDGVVWAHTLTGWLVLLGLALLVHIGGQGLIARAMADLPASFSSVALLLQPAVAAGLAWYLFGEALTLLQLAGAVAILAGVLLARYSSRAPA
jgi:drug/metabolite transporter (DMT)-like permease